jgi:hypothetical protein
VKRNVFESEETPDYTYCATIYTITGIVDAPPGRIRPAGPLVLRTRPTQAGQLACLLGALLWPKRLIKVQLADTA